MLTDDTLTAVQAVPIYTVHNRDHWTVVKFREDATGRVFVACGRNVPTASDTHVTLYGQWENKAGYGRQFHVQFFTTILPITKKGVISCLRSWKIGIGTICARNLYRAFGENLWHVLEQHPERLGQVPGVSKRTAERLLERYKQSQAIEHIAVLFQGRCEMNARRAAAIYEKFGKEAEEVIQSHPYRLCGVGGLTFRAVDDMAIAGGYPATGQGRMLAAVRSLMSDAQSRGNVCLPLSAVRPLLVKMLSCSKAPLTLDEAGLAVNESVRRDLTAATKTHLYLAQRLEEEKAIASMICRMLRSGGTPDRLDDYIQNYQAATGVTLAGQQAAGVKMVMANAFSVLTGGPGTGKTTTIRAILSVHRQIWAGGSRPLLLAPTGKAARRLSEATGCPAATVHSAVHYLGDREEVPDGEEEQLTADADRLEGNLLIVDEASMMDQTMTRLFLEKVPDGARVVLVGDPDQLPSVGCGNILQDLLRSGVVPVTKLDVIYRQGADSPIIVNAHKIHEGDGDLDFSSRHFRFLPASGSEEIFQKTVSFYLRCAKAYGLDNVELLCPYRHTSELNVDRFNRELQEQLNPKDPDALTIRCGSVEFREGDRVMQMKNTETAKNGDVGYIREIRQVPDPQEPAEYTRMAMIEWNGDGTAYPYWPEDMWHMDLAFCTTVHKAQGSEYQNVLFVVSGNHSAMLKRNVLYTAVTRATTNVALIGERSALQAAIRNNTADVRYTLLAQRLRQGMEAVSITRQLNCRACGNTCEAI